MTLYSTGVLVCMGVATVHIHHTLFYLPDCLIEKQYLFNHVIPNLRHFSQTQGFQFHAVDLFCDIPDILDNHAITSDCDVTSDSILHKLETQGALKLVSKEIELCQRVSAGPSFVVS